MLRFTPAALQCRLGRRWVVLVWLASRSNLSSKAVLGALPGLPKLDLNPENMLFTAQRGQNPRQLPEREPFMRAREQKQFAKGLGER
jgi:hypothetical protein